MRPPLLSAERLIRLYPRPWRERYGDEFVAMLGRGPLHPQQAVDIVFGAIDAWLSTNVRRDARADSGRSPGGVPMVKTLLTCERAVAGACRAAAFRANRVDALIGATVMLGVTILLLQLAGSLERAGWDDAAKALSGSAVAAALLVSMPFWLTKGQPWRAQAVTIGGTIALLVAIGVASTL